MKARSMRQVEFLTVVIAALLVIGTLVAAAQGKEALPEKTFKNVKVLAHTPVKSQGSTGTCWSYCTISLLESELMRQGKGEYELSEMFPVYHCYIERADYYVRAHGNNNFSQGGIDNDVLWTIRKFGIVRDADYSGLWPYESGHNHSELSRVLKVYLDAVMAGSRSGPSPKWAKGFTAALDAYLGPAPTTIDVDGRQVTPKQFADEILGIDPDDYVGVTSFTHMPFYSQVELLTPDNWKHHSDFYNVPLDELMAVIDYALENGFTVSIGSDVSEETFSGKTGYAIWHEDEELTPEAREAMWADWSTEDDHGMHIVGLAEDETGKSFYYTKNSWGNSGPFQGYVYISKNFVRAKVNSITVHKDAVPESIRVKLGIK
jgi:bleomycin hydrolase